MDGWTLHWLEAGGDLAPWRARIEAEIAAYRAIARLVPPSRLDVVVQRVDGWVIPETGMLGTAWRHHHVTAALDPGNPNFESALEGGALRRLLAHEVHHCLRVARLGFPGTLGEALVSEGMAGRFTQLALGNGPEPWECAVDAESLSRHLPDRAALDAPVYDHRAWFFGTGGELPRWFGYTLGYALVGEWLAVEPGRDPETLVSTPAEDVLAAALPRLARG